MVTLVGQGGEPVEVTGPLTDDELRASAVDVSDGNLPDYTGTWAYAAGTDGTPSIPAGARVLTVTAIGGTGGGTVTIDAGDTITVPEDATFTCNPEANLTGPTVVFTGTSSFFVDWIV